MIPNFLAGEIAIAVNWVAPYDGYNGTEVEVVHEPRHMDFVDKNTGEHWSGVAYMVRTQDSLEFACDENELRKRFDGGSWVRMRHVWQPKLMETCT